jgi:hypothetical protein
VSRARSWLERCRSDGEYTVRLITGRGRRSSGPAVLPGEIEHLLASLTGIVTGFDKESLGGAFIVRLKPASIARKPPQISLPRDPVLLRQAEEALSELGIAPTPALLAAEIKRLLAERKPRAE